jgi:hypothetical protein
VRFFFGRKHPERWVDGLPQRYRKYRRPPWVHGMTTDNELCFLETYAREVFSGAGRIVDLGCWFGATTLSLARGLAARGKAAPAGTIDALDRFEWESWMDPIAEKVSLPRRYAAGQSFYDEVKELLRPYAAVINVERQDLLRYTPPLTPVELLFIDAMKSWGLAQKIVCGFFPRLIAGCSYVVQQDFAYYHPVVATSHLSMWYLREHFRCVHHVPDSCSVVFFCTRPLEAAALPEFSPKLFTADLVEEAYEYCLGCVQSNVRVMLEIAKLCFLIQEGHAQTAINQGHRVARLEGVSRAMVVRVEATAQERLAATQGTKGPEVEWLQEILDWTAGGCVSH